MQDADLQILGATVEEDLLLGRSRTENAIDLARDMAGRLDIWDIGKSLCNHFLGE